MMHLDGERIKPADTLRICAPKGAGARETRLLLMTLNAGIHTLADSWLTLTSAGAATLHATLAQYLDLQCLHGV